jgi:hypothetical protein
MHTLLVGLQVCAHLHDASQERWQGDLPKWSCPSHDMNAGRHSLTYKIAARPNGGPNVTNHLDIQI